MARQLRRPPARSHAGTSRIDLSQAGQADEIARGAILLACVGCSDIALMPSGSHPRLPVPLVPVVQPESHQSLIEQLPPANQLLPNNQPPATSSSLPSPSGATSETTAASSVRFSAPKPTFVQPAVV